MSCRLKPQRREASLNSLVKPGGITKQEHMDIRGLNHPLAPRSHDSKAEYSQLVTGRSAPLSPLWSVGWGGVEPPTLRFQGKWLAGVRRLLQALARPAKLRPADGRHESARNAALSGSLMISYFAAAV
jgi:hypothetical protein